MRETSKGGHIAAMSGRAKLPDRKVTVIEGEQLEERASPNASHLAYMIRLSRPTNANRDKPALRRQKRISQKNTLKLLIFVHLRAVDNRRPSEVRVAYMA